jgi:transposase-like protein
VQEVQNGQPLKEEALTEEQSIRSNAVLASLRKGATVSAACEAADVSRSQWYEWLKKYPNLRRQALENETAAVAIVEDVLFAGALMALSDPRYQTSVIFFLKSRKRKVYGDRVSVVDETKVEAALRGLSDEQLAELATNAAIELIAKSEGVVGAFLSGDTTTAAEPEVVGRIEGTGITIP